MRRKEYIYRDRHGRKLRVSIVDLDECLAYTKEWRRRNPQKRGLQKKREMRRYYIETLNTAQNHYKRWAQDEIEYIRLNKRRKTAREIARDLGRTYMAIIVRACIEKISLLTEDKKHMRLVTGKWKTVQNL